MQTTEKEPSRNVEKKHTKKKKVASREEHINSVNKLVAARTIGKDCKCRKKCFLKVNQEKQQQILQKFNELGEHSVQNQYLAGLVTSTVPVRSRHRTGSRRAKSASNKYKIRLGQEVFDVCKKAFCALHGVSAKRVENIAANLAKPSTLTLPGDMRGRHSNRPNAISPEIVESIHTHITEFPKRKSHYSRSKNNGKYYLSPELNIRKLIQENQDRSPGFKPAVTYDFYYRYFKANFANYHFGHLRSDTCQLYDTLANKKKSVHTDAELNEIEAQLSLHQNKAKTFFDDLSQKTSSALEDPKVDTLCFDFQQNAPLPKVPSDQ
nr:uncharacterized protein LOC111417568 [Onthophagus taurus]